MKKLEHLLLNKHMKPLIMAIHPDRFNTIPQCQRVNTESLAKLNSIVDYAQNISKASVDTSKSILKFHIRHDNALENQPPPLVTVRFFLPNPIGDGRNVQRYVYRRLLYLMEKTNSIDNDISKQLQDVWQAEDDAELSSSSSSTSSTSSTDNTNNNNFNEKETKTRDTPLYRDLSSWLDTGRAHIMVGGFNRHAIPNIDSYDDTRKERLQHRQNLIEDMSACDLIRFSRHLSYTQRLNSLWTLKRVTLRKYKEWNCSQWIDKQRIRIAISHDNRTSIQSKFIVIPWNIGDKKLTKLINNMLL